MSERPRDVAHREIGRHDQQRHQPEFWTELVGVDVVAEWKSGQDAQRLVAPADDEGDDEEDDKMFPTVSTNPVHDGKAHEYAHRNERGEAFQLAIVQAPRGTQQHIKDDANPKPGIRCSRLIIHGRCRSFQASSSILQPAPRPFWRLPPGRQLRGRSSWRPRRKDVPPQWDQV